jgi:hypothetical protein
MVPDSAGTSAVLSEVAAVLWRERDVLEDLLFALIEQQLLLESGHTRWLARADAAVQEAAKAVQSHEVLRAIEVEMMAQQHGLPADVTLLEIVDHVPEPWPTVLQEHREALRALTGEIDAATARNRTLLLAGERATREALEQLGALGSSVPSTGHYDARGARPARRTASVLDEHA